MAGELAVSWQQTSRSRRLNLMGGMGKHKLLIGRKICESLNLLSFVNLRGLIVLSRRSPFLVLPSYWRIHLTSRQCMPCCPNHYCSADSPHYYFFAFSVLHLRPTLLILLARQNRHQCELGSDESGSRAEDLRSHSDSDPILHQPSLLVLLSKMNMQRIRLPNVLRMDQLRPLCIFFSNCKRISVGGWVWTGRPPCYLKSDPPGVMPIFTPLPPQPGSLCLVRA
jgi:hypothetical protein